LASSAYTNKHEHVGDIEEMLLNQHYVVQIYLLYLVIMLFC